MLTDAGAHWQVGSWVYGDYKTDVGEHTALTCARVCEEDPGCYHWNFHQENLRCDLKGENGSFNSDKSDWISGHSSRYMEPTEL